MQMKQNKRKAADAMNEAWRKLTPTQQLSILATRPGECKKQINRIKAQMEVKNGKS